ncbi:tail sheath stabilizer [Synechococcus phage S-T4]|uniref:Tail assembly protein n=1 Tax=Synechococcus phage S-T4 TaxID=2268578 RepID=A0A385EHM4_9CAUD|nr:tail sheath stabilizer [Synechococcus phage S-T4]AXQ70588.1 tail assembly protein [Synechococcus phage S-T4]
MSFEMTGISYDPSRKSNITKTFKAVDGENLKKVFLPVPYNVEFQLSIYAKLNEDALQIVEQILPYFQPTFKVTVDLISSIGEKRDIPIALNNITMQDEYEGNFESRRAIIYTLSFTANTYLFGPIAETTDGLIRKVQVDYYNSVDVQNAKREVRYTAVPDPIDAEPGDDFGFSETLEFFNDSKKYSPSQDKDI